MIAADAWHLTFVADGPGPPTSCRVRSLLKRALRTHGLRCRDFRPPPALPRVHDLIRGLTAADYSPRESR